MRIKHSKPIDFFGRLMASYIRVLLFYCYYYSWKLSSHDIQVSHWLIVFNLILLALIGHLYLNVNTFISFFWYMRDNNDSTLLVWVFMPTKSTWSTVLYSVTPTVQHSSGLKRHMKVENRHMCELQCSSLTWIGEKKCPLHLVNYSGGHKLLGKRSLWRKALNRRNSSGGGRWLAKPNWSIIGA